MIATTMYETIAPASRAVMSKAPPARIASFETVATTSPVECPFLIAGPGARGVVRDDLGHAERRLEPVRDREAVSHHARDGRRRAEPEQDQRPLHEGLVVVVDDAVLDRLADRGGHQRLRDHPDHAEEDPSEQGRPLEPRDPDEETQRRPGVRVAGVGEGELDHGCRCTENYAPEARRLIVSAASAEV